MIYIKLLYFNTIKTIVTFVLLCMLVCFFNNTIAMEIVSLEKAGEELEEKANLILPGLNPAKTYVDLLFEGLIEKKPIEDLKRVGERSKEEDQDSNSNAKLIEVIKDKLSLLPDTQEKNALESILFILDRSNEKIKWRIPSIYATILDTILNNENIINDELNNFLINFKSLVYKYEKGQEIFQDDFLDLFNDMSYNTTVPYNYFYNMLVSNFLVEDTEKNSTQKKNRIKKELKQKKNRIKKELKQIVDSAKEAWNSKLIIDGIPKKLLENKTYMLDKVYFDYIKGEDKLIGKLYKIQENKPKVKEYINSIAPFLMYYIVEGRLSEDDLESISELINDIDEKDRCLEFKIIYHIIINSELQNRDDWSLFFENYIKTIHPNPMELAEFLFFIDNHIERNNAGQIWDAILNKVQISDAIPEDIKEFLDQLKYGSNGLSVAIVELDDDDQYPEKMNYGQAFCALQDKQYSIKYQYQKKIEDIHNDYFTKLLVIDTEHQKQMEKAEEQYKKKKNDYCKELNNTLYPPENHVETIVRSFSNFFNKLNVLLCKEKTLKEELIQHLTADLVCAEGDRAENKKVMIEQTAVIKLEENYQLIDEGLNDPEVEKNKIKKIEVENNDIQLLTNACEEIFKEYEEKIKQKYEKLKESKLNENKLDLKSKKEELKVKWENHKKNMNAQHNKIQQKLNEKNQKASEIKQTVALLQSIIDEEKLNTVCEKLQALDDFLNRNSKQELSSQDTLDFFTSHGKEFYLIINYCLEKKSQEKAEFFQHIIQDKSILNMTFITNNEKINLDNKKIFDFIGSKYTRVYNILNNINKSVLKDVLFLFLISDEEEGNILSFLKKKPSELKKEILEDSIKNAMDHFLLKTDDINSALVIKRCKKLLSECRENSGENDMDFFILKWLYEVFKKCNKLLEYADRINTVFFGEIIALKQEERYGDVSWSWDKYLEKISNVLGQKNVLLMPAKLCALYKVLLNTKDIDMINNFENWFYDFMNNCFNNKFELKCYQEKGIFFKTEENTYMSLLDEIDKKSNNEELKKNIAILKIDIAKAEEVLEEKLKVGPESEIKKEIEKEIEKAPFIEEEPGDSAPKKIKEEVTFIEEEAGVRLATTFLTFGCTTALSLLLLGVRNKDKIIHDMPCLNRLLSSLSQYRWIEDMTKKMNTMNAKTFALIVSGCVLVPTALTFFIDNKKNREKLQKKSDVKNDSMT